MTLRSYAILRMILLSAAVMFTAIGAFYLVVEVIPLSSEIRGLVACMGCASLSMTCLLVVQTSWPGSIRKSFIIKSLILNSVLLIYAWSSANLLILHFVPSQGNVAPLP